MSDVNDLASSLFGTSRAEVASGGTYTLYGTAATDSSGGSVSVRMGADTLRADGQAGTSVLVPTTTDVRAGETVIVTVVDGHPVVTGVVGSGDRLRTDVDAAAGVADLAQRDVTKAQADIDQLKKDADAHGEQIEAVKQDIADYKATAEATYATKTEVDEKTGAISKTIEANYTKTADLGNTAAVKDAKAAGTAAQNALDAYKGTVSETYAEKTELTEAVNQLSSTMTSNYSAFADYRTSNDAALSNALNEIESVKTTYATKSELSATDTELSGKVSDALTTAKSYTDGSVSKEATARDAAIKASADSISLDVSKTYTKSDTFSAYQADANSRIATANATAQTAKSTADDAYSRTLRVQISSSPADATGDTSALTATVWRGGQQLTEQEVAMMGLVAWYVGGSRVATGYTYSCAAGTAVECRVEA